MSYIDYIKKNYNRVRNDDAVMWGSVAIVSALLEEMREAHPAKYWEVMRKTHEVIFGHHFDEMYAKWQVERMHHKGADGKEHRGEHWALEQTNAAMSKFRSKVGSNVNEYDFYVALNAQYHDYIELAKVRTANAEEQDVEIIEGAIAFYFADDDWPTDTKVWDYFSCQAKK